MHVGIGGSLTPAHSRWRAPWFWSCSLSRVQNCFGLVSPISRHAGKIVSVPDVSLGWQQTPHHTWGLSVPPSSHSSLSQRKAASLCKLNIYQIAFLKKTCICRNLGQTTQRIAPSKVISDEFRDADRFSLALSACMSQNKSKNDFLLEKKHMRPWHNC